MSDNPRVYLVFMDEQCDVYASNETAEADFEYNQEHHPDASHRLEESVVCDYPSLEFVKWVRSSRREFVERQDDYQEPALHRFMYRWFLPWKPGWIAVALLFLFCIAMGIKQRC
jgi:hypothetical protein